jgi:beta-lactamase regulating signal transducer with metallopeptidase domain
MVNSVFAVLVRLAVVGILGILVVGPLRVLARRRVGAEAAYWLWFLVPGSLIAVLLPRAPSCLCGPETYVAPAFVRGISTPLNFVPSAAVTSLAPTITLIWAIGAAVALAYFVYSQRRLRTSLGALKPLADGTYRSPAAMQPMVVGVWRPQIVLPTEFEARYSVGEQILVLAHERTHIERHDPLTNLIAVGLICLFWFNPLMYWGWNRFRFDQEAACDAAVLRRSKIARRPYARALAKAQIVPPAAIAFGWRGRHPLLARIAFIGRPTPHRTWRLAGQALALVLTVCGTYVVWAAQPGLTAPVAGANPCIDAALKPCELTPHFANAEIRQVAEAVALVTHKKFVIDARVHADVSMFSRTPISPQTFYRRFLDVLPAHGLIAVSDGDAIKIIPGASAR